jgi:hypothetical protein
MEMITFYYCCKRLRDMNDQEPQVIAEAVVAFALNNRDQERYRPRVRIF